MTLIAQLVHTIEDEFHELLDDTLINRFCRSLFCRHQFHQEISFEYPLAADTQWKQSLKKACTPTLEFTRSQVVSVKILIALILSNPKCSSDSIVFIKQIMRQSRILPILLELSDHLLRGARHIDDLSLFRQLYDKEICNYLCREMSNTCNFHVQKWMTNVLAQASLLGVTHTLCNDSKKLTESGISFLFVQLKLCSKMPVLPIPQLQIPASTIRTNIQDQNACHGANILYLMCANVLQVLDETTDQLTPFLTSLPTWNQLCTQTICTYLRHAIPVCNPLWHLIVSSWSDAVTASLSVSHYEDLCRLTNPVHNFARKQCALQAPQVSDSFLNKLLLEATHNSRRDEAASTDTGNFEKHQCHMWQLLSIFLTPQHSQVLDSASVRLSTLVSDTSHSSIIEVEAILDTSTKLCTLLTGVERISGFVQYLNKLAEDCAKTNVMLLLLRYSVKISSNMNSNLNENLTSEQCNCLVQTLNTVIERWSHVLSEGTQNAGNEIEDYPSANFYSEQFLSLAETLVKVILAQDVFDKTTLVEHRLRFLKVINQLVDASIVNYATMRILFACTVVHCIVSLLFDHSPFLTDANRSFVISAQNSFANLLNFDIMEVLGSLSTVRSLVQAQKKLNKVQNTDLSENVLSVVRYLNERINWTIEALEDSEHGVQFDSSCPECGETINDLIQDILIAHPRDMFTDCVEG